ncbi:PLC-like phosphodiesterase [Obelidium mucronatum]|nr:PLC-like phosphodiesterase [Obelidium mucronatum]
MISKLFALFTKPIRAKKLRFSSEIMSHRGGSLESIENTLAGFRKSANLGVDLLEMDIYMTKDGKCVVFHDRDMGRLCGLSGKKISDFNYDELPPLIIPSALSHIAGELNADSDARRIPLFEEVLREFPQYPMQVDVKEGSEELVITVGNLIRKYKREDNTVWGSFRDNVNNHCYNHFSTSIPLFFSMRRAAFSYVLSFLGVPHWMKYRESALICPNIPWLMKRSWFADLNRLGISVIVWGRGRDGGGPGGGVNTSKNFELIRKSGANGICTDRPTFLKAWLQEHGPLEKVDRFIEK